jgi:hypothetical protein
MEGRKNQEGRKDQEGRKGGWKEGMEGRKDQEGRGRNGWKEWMEGMDGWMDGWKEDEGRNVRAAALPVALNVPHLHLRIEAARQKEVSWKKKWWWRRWW